MDVVFHPTLIDVCKNSPVFKRQVIDLALEWVEKETELDFSKSFENETVAYRGGRGVQGNIPILFIVTEEMINGTATTDKPKNSTMNQSGVLSSTSSLLNHIQSDSNEAKIDELNISSQKQKNLKSDIEVTLPIPGHSVGTKGDKKEGIWNSKSTSSNIKLVQELDENGQIIPPLDSSVKPASVVNSSNENSEDKGLFGKVIQNIYSMLVNNS